MTATNEPRLTREMIEREILISPKFYGELQRLALIGLDFLEQRNIEQWKPVSGYPDYEISSYGNVISILNGERKIMNVGGRSRSNNGYRIVSLLKDKKRKNRSVHSLVMEAFGPPKYAENQLIRHLDGDPGNNRLDNLEWGSKVDNSFDDLGHGKRRACEKHPMRKLTKEQVIEMRNAYKEGRGNTNTLAKQYGIHFSTAARIICGRSWRFDETEESK